MLILKEPQITFWDSLLPAELQGLKEELAKVDTLLDDPQILAPYAERFHTTMGRPTVPVETYLRLMYLKFRYQLGYETLVEEVSDSLQWRRFCRIPLDKKVPHSTTLIKLTKRFGNELIEELNQTLIEKAIKQKIIRGRKLRVDTTVVEADIHHPTDASLLVDGVKVITRTVKQLREIADNIPAQFRDRTRSIKKQLFSIAKITRRRTGEAYQEVRQITSEIMDTAAQVTREAWQMVKAAKVVTTNQVDGVIQSLKEAIDITEQVICQTSEVLKGHYQSSARIVSIFDPEARPIKKGKLKAPTEFGYKVLLQETEEQVITGYQVLEGNPSDDTLLQGAVNNHKKTFRRNPQKVATDRGFGSQENEIALQTSGIKRCSLPRKGKLSQSRKKYQSQPWFKRLQRWRAGQEATISTLKRCYALRRSRFRGSKGTKTWVGFSIFAYNLKRLALKI